MIVKIATDNYKKEAAIGVAIFKDEKVTNVFLKDLDKKTGGLISFVLKTEDFKGAVGETAFLRFAEKNKFHRLLLIGVGEKKDYKASDTAIFAGTATRFFAKRKIKTFLLAPRLNTDAKGVAESVMQGVLTSQYELDKYKTAKKTDNTIEGFTLYVENSDEKTLKAGLKRGQIIGDSINFTRDLCNEPANILHPTEMANRAKNMAKEVGLECEILDEATMKKMGMNSLLSVSQGSAQPPKMIVLKYQPQNKTSQKNDIIAVVGKGVCFDTGGISLKAPVGMDEMKYDMGGGGAVIGIMRAIALLKPKTTVLGVVAAVENMPDGNAMRPGDVVTAMTGKTIEIENTDAEGRLILADAVAYAEKQGAKTIIDMATLTGAAIVALGTETTAILGNNQDLINKIVEHGKEVGEAFWQLPLGENYSKQIKSDIADIKNLGAKGKAGTIAGAVFVQEFIKDAKWAHLDIAGTVWLEETKPHQSKGPTAVPLRTLVSLIESC